MVELDNALNAFKPEFSDHANANKALLSESSLLGSVAQSSGEGSTSLSALPGLVISECGRAVNAIANGEGQAKDYVELAGMFASIVVVAHIPKAVIDLTEKPAARFFNWLHPANEEAALVRDFRFGDGFALNDVARRSGFTHPWESETVKVLEAPGVGPVGFASFRQNEALGMAVLPEFRSKSQLLLKAAAEYMGNSPHDVWLAALKPETSGRLVEFYAQKGKFEILERSPFRLPEYTAYKLRFPQKIQAN